MHKQNYFYRKDSTNSLFQNAPFSSGLKGRGVQKIFKEYHYFPISTQIQEQHRGEFRFNSPIQNLKKYDFFLRISHE